MTESITHQPAEIGRERGYDINNDGDGKKSHLKVTLLEKYSNKHFDPEGLVVNTPDKPNATLTKDGLRRLVDKKPILPGAITLYDRVPKTTAFASFGAVLTASTMKDPDGKYIGVSVDIASNGAPILDLRDKNGVDMLMAGEMGAQLAMARAQFIRSQMTGPMRLTPNAAEVEFYKRLGSLAPEQVFETFLVETLQRAYDPKRRVSPYGDNFARPLEQFVDLHEPYIARLPVAGKIEDIIAGNLGVVPKEEQNFYNLLALSPEASKR